MQDHKWTLRFEGKTKMYILSEYQLAGTEWIRISETQWAYLDAPLEEIRKRDIEREAQRRMSA